MNLHCKLVLVQYKQYEYGLLWCFFGAQDVRQFKARQAILRSNRRIISVFLDPTDHSYLVNIPIILKNQFILGWEENSPKLWQVHYYQHTCVIRGWCPHV